MTLQHSSQVWLELVGIVVWLLAMRLSLADLAELEQLAERAILESLQRADLCIKQAADLMGVGESHLREQLKRGPGRQLSFFRLLRLGWRFWKHFTPALISLLIAYRFAEVESDISKQHKP